MAQKKSKNYLIIVLLVLLVGISIGYAAFSQALNINGTASANGSFALIFDGTPVIEPSKGAEGSTATVSDNMDLLTIAMKLAYPGSGGVITTKIKNTGSVPAKLNELTFTGMNDTDIQVSYTGLEKGEIIQPNETKDVQITVQWNENSTVKTKTLTFSAQLDYVQATENFNVDNTVGNNI